MNNQLPATTTSAPRLPVPAGFDAEQWSVLTEAIFPRAKTARAIVLAVNYCKHRNLDILKKPVNIVPVWDSELGRYVEGLWPSINEIEVTASRTKEWAGMDPPVWGEEVTETFRGQRKDRKKGWIDVEVELTYPDYCIVTVYRLVSGQKCAFAEPVYWREAYARVGGSELPNEMWQKRPRGQLHKVAKAASLRAAFPEEGSGPTDDEMEGQTVGEVSPAGPAEPTDNWQPPGRNEPSQADAVVQKTTTVQQEPPDHPGFDNDSPEHERTTDADDFLDHDPDTGEVGPRTIERLKDEAWRDWCARLLVFIRKERELEPVDQWVKHNTAQITALLKDAPKIHANLSSAIGRHRGEILKSQQAAGGQDGQGL